MNKSRLILIILGLFLGLLLVLTGVVIYNNLKLNEVIKIIYNDDYEPGSESEVLIYNDRIEVSIKQFCSAIDCENNKIKKETFKYSSENIKRIKQFIKDNFKDNADGIINIHRGQLNEYQEQFITSLLYGEYYFEIFIEDFKYKIDYLVNMHQEYIIYFKDNNDILVKKIHFDENLTIDKIDTYSLNFTKENLKILNNYITEEAIKEKNNVIHKSNSFRKNEKNIIDSIINNDQSYLKDFDEQLKIAYTISYNGINCYTPTLILYNDNTYEYHYKAIIFGGDLSETPIAEPKTGVYNYDITNIINNIDKYEENMAGPYIIKDSNNKEYVTYNTNIELRELLNSIGVNLETCLES